MDGVINKAKEPFSIRKKDFWDVADAYKLLRPEFTVGSGLEIFKFFMDFIFSRNLLTSRMV